MQGSCALPGCDESIPVGSTTCSADHTKRFYAGETLERSEPGLQLVSTGALCTIIGVSNSSVDNWERQGLIHSEASGGRKRWDVERVKKEMIAAGLPRRSFPNRKTISVSAEDVRQIPEQNIALIKTAIAREVNSLGALRESMIKAAKEAARDVCLRAADRAKASGDHQLRADLLDDFVHLEEGLKMTFEPRGSANV